MKRNIKIEIKIKNKMNSLRDISQNAKKIQLKDFVYSVPWMTVFFCKMLNWKKV